MFAPVIDISDLLIHLALMLAYKFGPIIGLTIILPLVFIFRKADKPVWAAIIPFYNIIVTLQIIKKPLWWFFLLLIPIANILFIIGIAYELSRRFGKQTGFTVGIILLPGIFLAILGYGKAKYIEDDNLLT